MTLALATQGLAGCGRPVPAADGGPERDAGPLPPRAALADQVVEAPGASDGPFGDPELAVNGVRGGGDDAGSLDVYSLDADPEDSLVLAWGGQRVLDGPGVDLVVFENPFRLAGSDGEVFMDPTVVELSEDGRTWFALPFDYVAEDERSYSRRPADWVGFAGLAPVSWHVEDNPVDPFGPAAGGDAFDLAALGDEGEAGALRRRGARFVRLRAAAGLINPDTGERFVRDPLANGPDIDGVAARYLADAE
ncbi:MAG: LIC_13355 family lipoprotein [Sandaracinaceae bacterium]